MKKGFFYSLDAIISLVIIVSAIIIFSLPLSRTVPTDIVTHSSEDIINTLSNLKAGEADYPLLETLRINGTMTERQRDLSVMDYVTELWSYKRIDLAKEILAQVLSDFDEGAVNVYINDTSMYVSDFSTEMTRSSSSRVLTGFTQNRTIRGVSARSYLSGINNKVTSTFVFFGGFVGQGNVTKRGAFIPDSDTEITGFTFEAALGNNASLYVNGHHCKDLLATGVDFYDLGDCISNLTLDAENIFNLQFDPGDEFVGGGVIEVKYKTSEVSESEVNKSTIWIPGVEGLVNIYSSVNVPGELKSMEIKLHYDVVSDEIGNTPFFMKLGNVTVFNETAAAGETTKTITDAELDALLDYSEFDSSTVPMRIGFEDFSLFFEEESGAGDVILITDWSGSMKKAINDQSDQGNAGASCDDLVTNPEMYPDARKSLLAKCLDFSFVDNVTATGDMRVWPVFITSQGNTYLIKSMDPGEWDDPVLIKSYITSQTNAQPKAETCLSCALNEAYNLLDTYSNESRSKYVVFMTDGTPTHCSADGCAGIETGYGSRECEGYCDDGGSCATYEGCTDNLCDNAIDNTILSAKRLKDDLNTTIFSVGFGQIESCDNAVALLNESANYSGGKFYASSNVSELFDIYSEIAENIVESSRDSQIINIEAGTLKKSKIFDDSYIKVEYVPSVGSYTPGNILMRFLTDKFGSCSSTQDVPPVDVLEAYVTSFSDKYWTDRLEVNDSEVYNLGKYSSNYTNLGDPFIVTVPTKKIKTGGNDFTIRIGNSTDIAPCFGDSRLAYTFLIPVTLSVGDVYDVAEGCVWNIEYDGPEYFDMAVPSGYNGPNNCNYTISNVSYNLDDAIDNSVIEFLEILDIDSDGDVDVRLDENNLKIETIQINEIPGLWGPSGFRVEVSR